MINSRAIVGISVAMSFIAFGTVTALYLSPRLRRLDRADALRALVAPHMFRFVGLSFVMPGMVSPVLPAAFAIPAAYGDLAAAVLAVVAVRGLTTRARWAVPALWVFNLVGTVDLLFAFYQGMIGVGWPPGALGAAFYIPTIVVPPLLVTHVMLFRWSLRRG